jgi:hypothetical protein
MGRPPRRLSSDRIAPSLFDVGDEQRVRARVVGDVAARERNFFRSGATSAAP